MPAILHLHRLAWQELDAATNRLGTRFLDAAEHAIGLLATHPEAGRVIRQLSDGHAVRQFRIRGFKHVIIYSHGRSPPVIVVYAVPHARRRPGYWLRRMKNA